jgi:hypothetical protein
MDDRLKQIRQVLADYMWSEGCVGCCGNSEKHTEAEKKLAKLLKIPAYKDKSGYEFLKFKTKV